MKSVEKDFIKIIQENERVIYKVCSFYVAEAFPMEDLYQEVVHNLWVGFPKFRNESSISTWLYRIAINHCRNLQQSWQERHIFAGQDDFTIENAPSAHTESPLRVLETKELGKRIQTTLNRLPPEYRLILLLVADEELSYEEVGELTGQSGDAVRGKLHRARKAFAIEFPKTA